MGLHWTRGNLVLTRTDVTDDLVAVTLNHVVNVGAFGGALVTIFIGMTGAVYAIRATRFRRYFLLMGGRRVFLTEALQVGEG